MAFSKYRYQNKLVLLIRPRPGRSAYAFDADDFDTIAWYSASTELKLTLPCVRLIVFVLLPAYRSTIPDVLRVVFTQPLPMAECSLSRASVGNGFNFHMLTRSFTNTS